DDLGILPFKKHRERMRRTGRVSLDALVPAALWIVSAWTEHCPRLYQRLFALRPVLSRVRCSCGYHKYFSPSIDRDRGYKTTIHVRIPPMLSLAYSWGTSVDSKARSGSANKAEKAARAAMRATGA